MSQFISVEVEEGKPVLYDEMGEAFADFVHKIYYEGAESVTLHYSA